MKKLALALLFLVLSSPALAQIVSSSARLTYAYDVASTSYIYCKYMGRGDDPFESPMPGPVRVKTTGSSTTVAEVVTDSAPFADVAVGDLLFINATANAAPLTRLVTARASAASITVDTALDISNGAGWTWLKRSCGTAITDGWVNVAGFYNVTFSRTITTINATSIQTQAECKLNDNPTVATAVSTDSSTATGAWSFTLPNGVWDACRLGIKVTGDAGAQSTTSALAVSRLTNVVPPQAIGAATLGPQLAPPIAAANWTCGTGWDCSVTGTLNKNADGVGTAAPTTPITVTAGRTYRVEITFGTFTTGDAQFQLGGRGGATTLMNSTAKTWTEYVTPQGTGNLIITPIQTSSRFTIIGVSVQMVVDGTGDLTVDGNLNVHSPVYFHSTVSVLGGHGIYLYGFGIQGYVQTKPIADASATAFHRLALTQNVGGNMTGGHLLWHVHCDNGTLGTYADRYGDTMLSCNNISGTEACVFDTTAQQVTQAATYSLAAPAFTATGGTDTVDLNVNADCAGVVGPVNMWLRYRFDILESLNAEELQ